METSEAQSAAAGGVRGNFVLLGAGLGFLIALVVAVAWFVLAFRDPLPALTAADLEAAEARWEANKPASYDLDLQIGGLRAGAIHVEVRNGQVTAMTRDGQTPKQRRTWDVWSVEGQFATIYRELEMADDPQGEMQAGRDARLILRGEFDARLGYPRRFRRMMLGDGPEMSWEVTQFVPRS